jgi:PAS domain-containing protein
LFVSEPAEHVLGYPAELWLEEPTFWRDHIYSEDREWAVNFCIAATVAKRNHDFEYRMIAADGRIVWVRDLVTVVVEGDGATRLRGVMVDITKRKEPPLMPERARLFNLPSRRLSGRKLDPSNRRGHQQCVSCDRYGAKCNNGVRITMNSKMRRQAGVKQVASEHKPRRLIDLGR